MTFKSYFKLPAAQTSFENCVAHNGSLIPIPGRDVMVQGWYQGGISVFDWTDAAKPQEIAYFVPGAPKLSPAGAIQLNDVYVDDRSIVFTVDRFAGGLYILELAL